MNHRLYAGFATLGMAIGVALGAYGAHGLTTSLLLSHTPGADHWIEMWHKAVTYQYIHCLALLALVALADKLCPVGTKWAARFFMLGTCLFPGSIYIMVLSQSIAIRYITPIGGTSFILGWLFFFIAVVRAPKGAKA